MDLFIEFVGVRWYLFALAIGLLFLLMNHERRRGGPNVSPAQLTALINQHDAVVIDLRETAEFRQGHIVESISVPMPKLAERIAGLEPHRDKPVVLVCKHGHSTADAAKTLRQHGFTRVFKLGGGITEWQNQQLPLVRA